MNNLFNIIWLILLVFLAYPPLRQKILEMQRVSLIKKIERKRKSRVIALIHRQEIFSFLGIPFSRFIDIEDSESILRAIRLTPENIPIDMIIHTPGGLVLASEQIAVALAKREAPVTVFVPHYAMSGGTLLAIAADKIVMDENAILGSLDPQIGGYPAVSILFAVEEKPIRRIDDNTLILSDIARKGMKQLNNSIVRILKLNGVEEKKAKEIADTMSLGQWTHDFPIGFEKAKEIGLPVETGVLSEIYKLMSLYPQPDRRQSVEYIPVPYRKGGMK